MTKFFDQTTPSLSDADMARIIADPNYAKNFALELQKAIASENLDPITAASLAKLLDQIQQIIANAAASKQEASNAAPIEENNEKKPPKKDPEAQDDIGLQISEFDEERSSFFVAIADLIKKGLVKATNKNGEELLAGDNPDQLKNTTAFVTKDPATTKIISQKMANLFSKIPPQIGANFVKETEMVNGKEFHFHAFFTEGRIPFNPFSASKEEMRQAINNNQQKPSSSVSTHSPKWPLTLEAFKEKHIGAAVVVADASIEEINKFREQQILKIWGEYSEKQKSRANDVISKFSAPLRSGAALAH